MENSLISQKQCKIERFHLPVLQKNHSPIFCSQPPHLSQKWCEIEQLGPNFQPAAYLQGHLALFTKNCFPAIFGGHLEILHKNAKTWREIEQFQQTSPAAFSCYFYRKVQFLTQMEKD